jgi:hypothetical protein
MDGFSLKVLVIVWMVQHAGYPGIAGQAQGVFKSAAHC